MNNPLKGRAPAIAAVSLLMLVLSLFKPTGFEWGAAAAGLICSAFFWIDCWMWQEAEE